MDLTILSRILIQKASHMKKIVPFYISYNFSWLITNVGLMMLSHHNIASQLRKSLYTSRRCPFHYHHSPRWFCVQTEDISQWHVRCNCRLIIIVGSWLHGPLILWSKTHDLVCEVLSTLIHYFNDFVLLNSNLKSILYGKDNSFLYKLEFLIHS